MKSKPDIAVVGATGAVGIEMIKTLKKRNFPVGKLTLLASARSAGKKLKFRGEDITVQELTKDGFKGIDIALFSAGGNISREFGPIAAAAGCVVVDNSSAFRMDPKVPLVVPEINAADVKSHQGIQEEEPRAEPPGCLPEPHAVRIAVESEHGHGDRVDLHLVGARDFAIMRLIPQWIGIVVISHD